MVNDVHVDVFRWKGYTNLFIHLNTLSLRRGAFGLMKWIPVLQDIDWFKKKYASLSDA